MNDKTIWVTPKQIREKLGVCDATLRRWANNHQVDYITPVSNHRLYNINTILKLSSNIDIQRDVHVDTKREYCYCRVSSTKQQNDLDRQKIYMQQQFPAFTVVSDVGSGINWKRPMLRKLVAESINGKVKTIVVAHRDRLCRFGFELLEHVFETCGVKLLVLNGEQHSSTSNELVEDLLSIIHVFNCREMGKRRYSTTNAKDNTDCGTTNEKESDTEEKTREKENEQPKEELNTAKEKQKKIHKKEKDRKRKD